MTLVVLDEYGKLVNEDNPIIIEHNGTTGSVVLLTLSLVNTSPNHYYRDVTLGVKMAFPVQASLLIQGEVVPNYLPNKRIGSVNPNEIIKFNLKSEVPPNISERIIRGVNLNISGTRYQVP